MSTWFRNIFRDSQRAQVSLLLFAVVLGVIGFLIVFVAVLVAH
jgi:hypothetical protein